MNENRNEKILEDSGNQKNDKSAKRLPEYLGNNPAEFTPEQREVIAAAFERNAKRLRRCTRQLVRELRNGGAVIKIKPPST